MKRLSVAYRIPTGWVGTGIHASQFRQDTTCGRTSSGRTGNGPGSPVGPWEHTLLQSLPAFANKKPLTQ